MSSSSSPLSVKLFGDAPVELIHNHQISDCALRVYLELSLLSSAEWPNFYVNEAEIATNLNKDLAAVKEAIQQLENSGFLCWSGDWIQLKHKIYTLAKIPSAPEPVPEEEVVVVGPLFDSSLRSKVPEGPLFDSSQHPVENNVPEISQNMLFPEPPPPESVCAISDNAPPKSNQKMLAQDMRTPQLFDELPSDQVPSKIEQKTAVADIEKSSMVPPSQENNVLKVAQKITPGKVVASSILSKPQNQNLPIEVDLAMQPQMPASGDILSSILRGNSESEPDDVQEPESTVSECVTEDLGLPSLPRKRKITQDDLPNLKEAPEYILSYEGEKCFPLVAAQTHKYWRCHNFYAPDRHRDFIMLTINDLVEITTDEMAVWILAEYGWRSIDAALQEVRGRVRIGEKLDKPLKFVLDILFRMHLPQTKPPYDLKEMGGLVGRL